MPSTPSAQCTPLWPSSAPNSRRWGRTAVVSGSGDGSDGDHGDHGAAAAAGGGLATKGESRANCDATGSGVGGAGDGVREYAKGDGVGEWCDGSGGGGGVEWGGGCCDGG